MNAPDNYQPDSLIFDMDGTLWDAVQTYADAWNEYFDLNNIDNHLTKSDLDIYMGLEQKYYLEKIIPQYSIEERNKMYKESILFQYKMIDTKGGFLYDGVVEGLKLLSSKYKVFIVSNCPEFTIPHFMKWAGIEQYITDSMAHGQNYKPKSENIQFLIEKHALKNPLYIGDTDSDRIQSEKANVPFVFVEYGFGKCNHYHKKFDSFIGLTDYYIGRMNE